MSFRLGASVAALALLVGCGDTDEEIAALKSELAHYRPRCRNHKMHKQR